MKGHNYGLCKKCGRLHEPPRGTFGKKLHFKDIERRRVWARALAEKSRKIVLTEDVIQRIKTLYDIPLTQSKIAKIFGVSQSLIWRIMKNTGLKTRPPNRFTLGHPLTEKQIEILNKGRKPFKKGHISWDKDIGNREKCDSCNNAFHRAPSRVHNHVFCNRNCYLIYQKLHGKELATIPKPNQGELQLLDILKRTSENWKYVGDGQFWIGGKNPDFWDGGNHIIELFGGTWHNNDEGQERIIYFQKRDYYCKVIWYSQLRNPEKLNDEINQWISEKKCDWV